MKKKPLPAQGRMTQEQRQSGFNKFNRASAGVLICTDIAARGWDVSQVNVIVQYDPPDDPRYRDEMCCNYNREFIKMYQIAT